MPLQPSLGPRAYPFDWFTRYFDLVFFWLVEFYIATTTSYSVTKRFIDWVALLQLEF